MQARVILPGAARGRLLRLDEPISFWGGIDPASGRLTDPSSRHHGCCVKGRVLMAPATRGSSSSSAVLLQLLHGDLAPAALILGAVDAIVGLGILVAGEMGWPVIPLLTLPPDQQSWFRDGVDTTITVDGRVVATAEEA